MVFPKDQECKSENDEQLLEDKKYEKLHSHIKSSEVGWGDSNVRKKGSRKFMDLPTWVSPLEKVIL